MLVVFGLLLAQAASILIKLAMRPRQRKSDVPPGLGAVALLALLQAGCTPTQLEPPMMVVAPPSSQSPQVAGALIGAATGAVPGAVAGGSRLTAARVFLPPENIPPSGVGAYGILALRATPTEASAGRLTMACKAFLASLPSQASLPASVALADQMLTIWPLLSNGLDGAEQGSCPHMLRYYALVAGQAAIADAQVAAGRLDGAGPFLIGWSPSNKRGVPDAVVLIVDMSGLNSQERFDDAFRFWQQKVIGDPQLWRNGFDAERLRLSVRDFVDRYGTAILSSVKLWGG